MSWPWVHFPHCEHDCEHTVTRGEKPVTCRKATSVYHLCVYYISQILRGFIRWALPWLWSETITKEVFTFKLGAAIVSPNGGALWDPLVFPYPSFQYKLQMGKCQLPIGAPWPQQLVERWACNPVQGRHILPWIWGLWRMCWIQQGVPCGVNHCCQEMAPRQRSRDEGPLYHCPSCGWIT